MMQIDWVNSTTLTSAVLIAIAFALSAVVGIERHRQVKSAVLRTHTLVGAGSALFTLVSAYGFSTIAGAHVTVDPTRIAAQIVSGIGFIGAGVIFVRKNIVTGLTTAASIWLVAAIGMACGARMPVLAALGTALHLVAVRALSPLSRRIPVAGRDRKLWSITRTGEASSNPCSSAPPNSASRWHSRAPNETRTRSPAPRWSPLGSGSIADGSASTNWWRNSLR